MIGAKSARSQECQESRVPGVKSYGNQKLWESKVRGVKSDKRQEWWESRLTRKESDKIQDITYTTPEDYNTIQITQLCTGFVIFYFPMSICFVTRHVSLTLEFVHARYALWPCLLAVLLSKYYLGFQSFLNRMNINRRLMKIKSGRCWHEGMPGFRAAFTQEFGQFTILEGNLEPFQLWFRTLDTREH